MPEYLAPGVYVEETSFRSKSIEGVSTTTTGFVGPSRYGPVDLVPDVLTSLSDFERCYGDKNQLAFEKAGTLHNYLCHAVRAFFEEGGKRVYVARAFRPSSPANAVYQKPDAAVENDLAVPVGGKYVTDGHGRIWLTQASRAVAEALKSTAVVAEGVAAMSAGLVHAATTAVAEPYSDADVLNALVAVSAGRVDAGAGMPDLLAKAAAAKTAFPASSMEGADLDAKLKRFKTQLDLASAADAALDAAKVLDPAVTALIASVKTGVGDALKAAAKAADDLNTFVPAVGTDPTVGAALKAAAADLKAACAGDTTTQAAPATNAANYRTKYDDVVADAGSKIAALESVAGAASLKASVVAAQAGLDQVTGAIATLATAVATTVGTLATAIDAAAHAYAHASHPRVYALNDLLIQGTDVSNSLAALQHAATATRDAVLTTPPAGVDDALLLRARFPGAFGNLKVNVGVRIGQNALTAGAAKSVVQGLQPGDLVWIGLNGDSADGRGKLYLANLKADGSDWHFSEDGTTATARYWLGDSATAAAPRLDPATQAVRLVTVGIDVPGYSDTWAGLAFQPGHRNNGSADAVLDRFQPNPPSAQDARTLPIEILAGKNLKHGRKVFEALCATSAGGDFALGDFPLRLSHLLVGGNDGERPGADEYAGRGEGPDDPKTGLKAFEDIEDISIVAAPGATFGYERGYGDDARQTIAKLIAHAENMRYRVAVLDCGDNQSIQEVRSMRARIDSKHAALYYPWICILDPVTRGEIKLPPSGFVAGIYARNDIDRAVHKAPANEVVRGALSFERVLNKAQQDVLNPEGINCFRFFAGRGNRLWGARTISSDPEWKYLNVRRYFAYLEHSIDRGTQWAVFEPNGDPLWANVRETIGDFLYNEWRNGALLGVTPEKAFFVRCDRSTMTQNDLDNGRLVCLIGVAVVKPAEYVIFRVGQWTADRKN